MRSAITSYGVAAVLYLVLLALGYLMGRSDGRQAAALVWAERVAEALNQSPAGPRVWQGGSATGITIGPTQATTGTQRTRRDEKGNVVLVPPADRDFLIDRSKTDNPRSLVVGAPAAPGGYTWGTGAELQVGGEVWITVSAKHDRVQVYKPEIVVCLPNLGGEQSCATAGHLAELLEKAARR